MIRFVKAGYALLLSLFLPLKHERRLKMKKNLINVHVPYWDFKGLNPKWNTQVEKYVSMESHPRQKVEQWPSMSWVPTTYLMF